MKISVVVPVYNAEKYLAKCIDSVLKQTYTDWELILIDDGSTDGSADIVDRAAAGDGRIIAVHQKNAGPGEARNCGIDVASGDYVVFLDSDDYIAPEYFALLEKKAFNCDLVFIDVLQVDPNGKELAEERMSRYQEWDKDRILRSQMTGKIPWGGVRKAVSVELLRRNNIRYTTYAVGEEALYSFRVLHAATSVSFIREKPVYYYVNHEGSQSKTLLDDPWGPVASNMTTFLKDNKLYSEYADTANAFQFTAAVVSLDRIARAYSGNERVQKAKQRVEQLLRSYDRSAGIDTGSMSFKAKIFVPFLKIGAVWPVLVRSDLRVGIER